MFNKYVYMYKDFILFYCFIFVIKWELKWWLSGLNVYVDKWWCFILLWKIVLFVLKKYKI